jgi:hypothetical protein
LLDILPETGLVIGHVSPQIPTPKPGEISIHIEWNYENV